MMKTPEINPDDAVYLAALKAGDRAKTQELFYTELSGTLKRIRHRIFLDNVGMDELVNELYLYLAADGWKRLGTFTGRDGTRLRTWIGMVAWHFFTSRGLPRLKLLPADSKEGGEGSDTPVADSERQVAYDVRSALDMMPNRRYARLLTLLLEGFTPAEAAAALHTSTSNIYNLKHRAIAQFLKFYN